MVYLLNPEELARFAELEQLEKETRIALEELKQRVESRDLGFHYDDDPDLAQLDPEDRRFVALADAEELFAYAELGERLATAMVEMAKMIRTTGERKR